jgi:two-component system CheB/CheR fusion protein
MLQFLSDFLRRRSSTERTQELTVANERLQAEIEERKHIETALRESEQRFARFMQHLPGLAWIKDCQGRYVFANDSAVKAFRKPREELYGRTDDEIFPPGTAAQFKQNDQRALASDAGFQTIEVLEHEDGVLHHSMVSKFPIFDTAGKPVLVGGVAFDVTDRVQAEEAIRQSNRRKEEFLATLAHELRNPLAPIRNALKFLQYKGPPDPEMQNARTIIDRQVDQMARLVDDLLDVSRISRGKINLVMERVNLGVVVANAVEASRPLIDAAGHELTVTLPAEPVYLHADVTRLAQVLLNLLNNAAKYTPPRGRIALSAEIAGDEVVLRVRDNGIGIPANMLTGIFDLFSQVDNSMERTHGGLGIGLTIVKSLVEMHGGSAEARSEGPGQGSEFILRLPISREAVPMPEPPFLDGVARPAARLCALVVDDNHDAADSLAMLLKVGGYDVRTAYDGPKALELSAQSTPDVMFLDLGMPKMNGCDVAMAVRRQPWGKGVCLIAITGWGTEEDRRRTSAAGFDHHLVKPADHGVIMRLLSDLEKDRHVIR